MQADVGVVNIDIAGYRRQSTAEKSITTRILPLTESPLRFHLCSGVEHSKILVDTAVPLLCTVITFGSWL
jgi:hypothetical protein